MYQDPSLRTEVARLHQRELAARALSRSPHRLEGCADLPPRRPVVAVGTLAQRLTAMLPARAWRPQAAC